MLDWIQHLVDDDVDETSVLLGDSGDSPRRADARDSGSTPSKPGEAGGSANKKKGIGVVSLVRVLVSLYFSYLTILQICSTNHVSTPAFTNLSVF